MSVEVKVDFFFDDCVVWDCVSGWSVDCVVGVWGFDIDVVYYDVVLCYGINLIVCVV